MADQTLAKPSTLGERFRPGGWPRRMAIGGAVSLLVFAIVGFFVVPPIARRVAEKELGQVLGRRVAIARVRVNPFALSLAVEGFQVFEGDGITPFVGFGRLYVNAQLSSVFRRAPVVKEISLESLRIHVVRLKATPDAWADTAAYNFSDIMARLGARPAAAPPEPGAGVPRFSLNNIRITDGALTFEDRPLGSRHEVTDLAVGVPFVSTLPVYLDSFVQPGLSVRIDGTPFAIAGRTKPFTESLETLLEVRLNALDLTQYMPFVPLSLPFSVESARLTLALDVSFVRPRADAPTLRVKGRVALEKLDIREKRAGGGLTPLVALESLDIGIGDSDITGQRFQVDKVALSGLDVHVRRLRDGTLNLEHMIPVAPAPAARARTPPARPRNAGADRSPGPRFALQAFTLEKATVHVRDETVTPAFVSEVRDIAVSVSQLSNAPGATAQVRAGLRAMPGGTLAQQGTLRLMPLSASGSVSLDGLEPARLAPYFHDLVTFDIIKGKVRVGAHYSFEQSAASPSVRLSEGLVEISDVALRRRGAREDFFQMDELAVHGAALDLGHRTVTVATLTTRNGRVRAARDAKGVVDLTTLVGEPASPEGAPAVAVKPAPPPPAAAESPPAAAWTVEVARFDLEGWAARFEDRAVSPPAVVSLGPLALHVSKLSTAADARAGVDLRLGINKRGRLTVAGTAGLAPIAANLRFDLHGIEILPLQPYFRDQVALTVTSGAVSVKGHVGLLMKARKAAEMEPQLDLDADLDVAELATVDRDRQEALVKWSAFHVGGLKMSNHPLAVGVGEVTLTDLDARLVSFPDGRLNLPEALAAPGASKKSEAAPKEKAKTKAEAKSDADQRRRMAAASPSNPPPPPVNIGKVTIQRGHVQFTDRAIQPNVTAELADLECRVSGLSSSLDSTADVNLHATVNRSGSLAITGQTNPLAKDLFVDLHVAVKDVELPPASPYAGKFAGYAISKGKLELALDYKVLHRNLDAKNKLVLDQFTFGDKVDSPDAVKAPVRLAVALLKDRHGVIDIDLPISGSLDDPKFKVWPAVLKVLGNLLVKAATAPFTLIASAFGGGDELSRVDFASGASTLDATAQRKLHSLGKALQERPALSLEIEGIADPKPDRDGLRRFVFERRLKVQKQSELVQGGAPVSSADSLQLDAADRARLLEKAYREATFAGKPKNGLGLAKDLPPDQMEKLMLANTQVVDDDLRALALRRATALQVGLAKEAPAATGRLFLVTPRLSSDGGHVELKLKKD